MQITKVPNGICEAVDRCNRKFIWGEGEDRRKVHLVAWEEICKPINEWLEDVNIAFLAKFGGKMTQDCASLSYTWRSILKAHSYKRHRVAIR